MKKVNSLNNKKILITGGSGSLGRHIIAELVKRGASSITSISRDEGLAKEAREFVGSDNVNFIIGDIKDPQTTNLVTRDIDLIFHTAAMKDVVFAEKHPREILKSNILGTLNLLNSSEKVEKFINVSSDKAIGVVNCYGASKLLAEYLVNETNELYKGEFLNLRCPNFLGSRGSVIDIWKYQIKKSNKIILTDPTMTRFFITLPEAAGYIVDLGTTDKIENQKIYYPYKITKKFILEDLAKAFISFFPDKKVEIKILGKRGGEKIHEGYVSNIPTLSVAEIKKYLQPLIS